MKSKSKTKKLVLFDIDGTLIRHVKDGTEKWRKRIRAASLLVYGVDPGDFVAAQFHGNVDRQIIWSLVEPLGVSRKKFLDKIVSFYESVLHMLLLDPADQALYVQIPEAKALVDILSRNTSYFLGVITGNMEKIARWKLTHGGYDGLFPFGVWSDGADNRFELASSVYGKSNAFFHKTFYPDDTIIIGDTVHDVTCARHIGARVIAVTTGGHAKEELAAARPDLLVDSLMDERVLSLLGLSP